MLVIVKEIRIAWGQLPWSEGVIWMILLEMSISLLGKKNDITERRIPLDCPIVADLKYKQKRPHIVEQQQTL